ncbi:phosphate uptake regulator PhoU [Methanoplanus sp. FWC-SCC4]|uniref:Phosphate uptake regulator PhoU n=1 Tax=Methanochimaera problematica TaxID=2609417 RepID=A0AA97I4C1_9EURY|nr:phosphate uptake regulator PhoU [Methanoplanus sp. FWC-SCC4]WOF16186.1 phosphate uptake regulator PhoU [Methanoplanus sp. FWC-SCC4]
MEVRKVQITGGSSYIVSLPKEWIRNSNIKKNDPLGLIIQPDGSLTVTPKITGKIVERIKEFDLKGVNDHETLYRLLIGAYVTGYNTIRITSHGRLPSYAHRAVRMFIQSSIGQEVSEETETTIIIKDLLNPGEMPFENVISRMKVIIEGMLGDSMFALKTRDTDLADDVMSREKDVNRLYWLISRQYNLLLRNISLSGEMGMDVDKALHYLQASRVLERAGDQVESIAENVQSLLFVSIEKRALDTIQSLSSEAIEILDSSIEAFFNNDLKKTTETINKAKLFGNKCNDASQELFDIGRLGIVSIAYIIGHLKRIGEYASVISDISINYIVMNDEPLK